MKSSKLPIQSAPIERTLTGAPMSKNSGVDPSFSWGDIWDGIKKYGPSVVKGVASLL